MLRCTYRLTDNRTVVSQAKLPALPRSGDQIMLNNLRYQVDKVNREGDAATIYVGLVS